MVAGLFVVVHAVYEFLADPFAIFYYDTNLPARHVGYQVLDLEISIALVAIHSLVGIDVIKLYTTISMSILTYHVVHLHENYANYSCLRPCACLFTAQYDSNETNKHLLKPEGCGKFNDVDTNQRMNCLRPCACLLKPKRRGFPQLKKELKPILE